MMVREGCMEHVYDRWGDRRCSRFAVADSGYCKQHNPKAVEARRLKAGLVGKKRMATNARLIEKRVLDASAFNAIVNLTSERADALGLGALRQKCADYLACVIEVK